MPKIDGVTTLTFVVTATIALVAFPFTPPELTLTTIVSSPVALMFLGGWTVCALPVTFFMPRLRVAFLSHLWRAPAQTYLMPQWLVRFSIGAMFGQCLAMLILAVAHDHRLLWLAASSSLLGGAFCVGAWRRLMTHPRTEFTMRWWSR
jgi:hypothetical protein